MEKNQFSKKEFKDQLYDVNQILKTMYDSYNCHDNFIHPLDERKANSILFMHSMAVLDDSIDYQFLKSTSIDPKGLNIAFKLKGKTLEWFKDNDSYYIQEENNSETKVRVSTDMLYCDIQSFGGVYSMIDNPTEYPFTYELTQEDIEYLLDYNSRELCLGYDELNNPIRFITTLKVFPAIKKADHIIIYAKRCNRLEKNMYKLMIVSELVDKLRIYTIHHIINF